MVKSHFARVFRANKTELVCKMAKTMEYLLFTAMSQQTIQARNNIADINAAYSRTKFLSLKKPMATITNFSLLRGVIERLVKAFTRCDNICWTRTDASR